MLAQGRAGWRGFAHRRLLRCGMREGNEGQMFDSLSDRLGDVFGKLRGRGALTEADVRAAMREVRIALLEADVDRKSVVEGKSGSVRVDLGGRRRLKKKNSRITKSNETNK